MIGTEGSIVIAKGGGFGRTESMGYIIISASSKPVDEFFGVRVGVGAKRAVVEVKLDGGHRFSKTDVHP